MSKRKPTKKKKKLLSRLEPNNSATAVHPEHSFTFPWVEKPCISSPLFQKHFSQVGIFLSIVCILGIGLFGLRGYQLRPRILDSKLIEKIIRNPKDSPNRIYHINARSPMQYVQNDTQEYLRFQFGPDTYSGFIIPKEMLDIPDDARNVGMSMFAAYKGIPNMAWGFLPELQSVKISNILKNYSHVNNEYYPSLDSIRAHVIIATHYYSPDKFEVHWKDAKYIFFLFHSSKPTDFYLEKMLFIEKW
jgi:hypothetical protein